MSTHLPWLYARDAKQEPDHDGFADPEQDVEADDRVPGIRCPRCGWRPRRQDRWSCTCGHQWNTFETAGRCPACDVQWESTQCHRCIEWSPHREWYEHD